MTGKPAEQVPASWPVFLVLIVSLAFMQPAFPLFGLQAVPTDLLYLALLCTWVYDLARGRARLIWHRAFWFLAAYLAAMLVSAAAAGFPSRSIIKLSTQVYLLTLPIIVVSLTRSQHRFRQAVLAWLSGAALVAVICVISLSIFAIDPQNPWLAYTNFGFGSLPSGNYPRLRLTFANPNMLCNYLTVCLSILLLGWRKTWIPNRVFLPLLLAILLCSAFTISPGLGGVALLLGYWVWLELKGDRPVAARLSIAIGIACASAFVVAAALTPFGRPGDPVLLELHHPAIKLVPAVRSFIWAEAVRNFLAHPVWGLGIGSDAVLVHYRVPSGFLQTLTDAHNVYLSIAVQCGIIGLIAICALLHFVWQVCVRSGAQGDLVPLLLGFAFLNAFAYQGLTGSFEDARHLWILFGLMIAGMRISGDGG